MTYLWKEWIEQSRAKGLWLALGITIVLTFVLLFQSVALPSELGFAIFLLSLYDMLIYLLPILCMFIAAYSLLQEKENRTLMIIMTKKESFFSFLIKKSIAIHGVTLSLFIAWFLLFILPAKFMFTVEIVQYLPFIAAISIVMIIFNQIGILLGSLASSRMFLIGAVIFVWFSFIFLADIIYLYFLPSITYENVKIFSIFYFIDPLHTIRFFLESSLGLFPLEHLSRFMEQLIWLPPSIFLMVNLIVWSIVPFCLSIIQGEKGVKS